MKQLARKPIFLLVILITAIFTVACAGPPAAPAEEEVVPAEEEAAQVEEEAAPAEEEAAPVEEAAGPTSAAIVPDVENFPRQVFDAVPDSFNEAPMLAEMVAAGELPPVEERLPKEPMVLEPSDEIGKYGGTWNRAFTGPADHQNIERISKNHMLFWDTGMTEVQPHIARDFEVNDDNTEFTFYLREGMKWSDGAPFTADDIMFWYEDILLNDDLVPAKPGWAKAGGELGVWEKIDDYAFKVTFPQPYGVFFELVAGLTVNGHFTQLEPCSGGFSPKHYMTQFHADYIGLDEANALAAERGFDNWAKLFCFMNDPNLNSEAPVTTAWKPLTDFSQQQVILERNPYYWAVDTEGNQLPYIDRIVMSVAEDLEVLNLKAIAGEYDLQARHIDINKLPVLLENAEEQDYRIQFFRGRGGSASALAFNQDYDGDPEIAKFIQNADFRRALSMAIDREQINEAFYLGLGRPASACSWPDPPYDPGEEYDQLYSTLDVEEANRLLDSIGLDQKDDEGFRLMPDGRRLVVEMMAVSGAFQDWPGIAEMFAQQWKENVGIAGEVDAVERSLRNTRLTNNDTMTNFWGADGSEALFLFPNHTFAFTWESGMGPMSGQWFQDHSIWHEPTGPVREQQLLFEEGAALSREQRVEIGKKMRQIGCEQVFYIGTVTDVPAWTAVIKNNMRNIATGFPFTTVGQTPGNTYPETWYFTDADQQ
jgi:peptide/nickel transport system substrate-binding protein